MKKTIIALILIGYLASAILTYGMSLAHFQNKFPSIADRYCRQDMGTSVIIGIFSPISTGVMYLVTGFAEYGIQLQCNKYLNDEREDNGLVIYVNMYNDILSPLTD